MGGTSKPVKYELEGAMGVLDIAWASFEKKYISELIGIEYQARQLIVDACTLEEQLTQLEACHVRDENQIEKTVKQLVTSISRLNATANARRKGRDDLRAEILFSAEKVLRRCDIVEQSSIRSETVAAARIIATDV